MTAALFALGAFVLVGIAVARARAWQPSSEEGVRHPTVARVAYVFGVFAAWAVWAALLFVAAVGIALAW